MMMKKLLLTAAAIALAGCASMHNIDFHRSENPYEKPQFYQRYLNPNDPYDQRIQRTVDALRANPSSATLHNDLGQMLVRRGFTNDAEKEFGRAIRADRNFYPAYYNRAQLRAGTGDFVGARQDFLATVRHKPGHAEALFQLGLMEEQHQNDQEAINYYAKAITINHALLDVHVNPRVLDSKLIPIALIRAYPKSHAHDAIQLSGTPPAYTTAMPAQQPAPSPQPTATQIVTPAPPVTDPGVQKPKP
jgi:tetratricopeptide (TPR) repeat protein